MGTYHLESCLTSGELRQYHSLKTQFKGAGVGGRGIETETQFINEKIPFLKTSMIDSYFIKVIRRKELQMFMLCLVKQSLLYDA